MSTTSTRPRKPARPASKTRRPAETRRSFGQVRQERSGRWSAHYTDPTTKRRVSAAVTFETYADADDWLTTVRADMLRGVHRSPVLGAVPLADYAARWIANHAELAPRTREMYADLLRRWIDRDMTPRPVAGRPLQPIRLGSMNLNTLTVAVVREWFAAATYTQRVERAARDAGRDRRHPARIWAQREGIACEATGKLPVRVLTAWKLAGSPGPVALAADADVSAKPSRIIRQSYTTLRACLADAVRDGLIDANPCQLPGAGSSHAAERRPATPAEVAVIANAMPDRYRVAVLVAAWSGLRAGELFGLAREHVDLSAGTVRVERSLSHRQGPGRPVFGATKTAASRRTVALPASVVAELTAHMSAYTGASPDALVFARDDGSPLPANRRTQLFARARHAAGRPDLRWHDLRHTGATLAAQTGASIRDIQHRLGHSTIAAAIRYQHTSAAQDRMLADRLDLLATGRVVPMTALAAVDGQVSA